MSFRTIMVAVSNLDSICVRRMAWVFPMNGRPIFLIGGILGECDLYLVGWIPQESRVCMYVNVQRGEERWCIQGTMYEKAWV